MNWILENLNLIIILFILTFVIFGMIRGFFAQLEGFIVTITAFIFASIFAKPLLNFFSEKTSLVSNLSQSISQFISNSFPPLSSIEMSTVNDSLASLPLPANVVSSIQRSLDLSQSESINLCDVIGGSLAGYIVLALCYFAVFIAVKIIFKFIRIFAVFIRRIQLLKLTDIILGAALGFIKSILIIYAVTFLINLLPFSWLESIKQAIDSSFVLKFMSEHNLFSWLIGMI